MDNSRPRDLIGYGRRRPQADWPHKARIALSFVLNYEEGGEHNRIIAMLVVATALVMEAMSKTVSRVTTGAESS